MKLFDYQVRIDQWMQQCFGPRISADGPERNYRFLEEALELVQALECSQEDAHRLVDYVYGRPAGVPRQEVGGVMVTLAALCNAQGINMERAATGELDRINQPDVMERIRQKQATKPQRSPLPGAYADIVTTQPTTDPALQKLVEEHPEMPYEGMDLKTIRATPSAPPVEATVKFDISESAKGKMPKVNIATFSLNGRASIAADFVFHHGTEFELKITSKGVTYRGQIIHDHGVVYDLLRRVLAGEPLPAPKSDYERDGPEGLPGQWNPD